MAVDVRKDRIQAMLREKGVKKAADVLEWNHKLYSKVARQLFTEDGGEVTIDVLSFLCDKYTDISALWMLNGEGPKESTHVVTPPTHRQDIHIAEGATAAISQSGTASATPAPAPADEKKSDTFTYEDVARMVRDNDLGGLVGIIFAQQQQIIRYEQQRNADLLREMHMVDSKLFPEPK